MRLTALAHTLVAPHLRPGDLAIDATAGNGHDTMSLAKAVGAEGHVWAFDIQENALEKTGTRLRKADVSERVTLILASHEKMSAHLPSEAQGRITAIMANLGYLPGGDTRVITKPEATSGMLDEAVRLLRSGGILCITAYPGHEGGDADAASAHNFLENIAATHRAPVGYHGEPLSPDRNPWLAFWIKP